MMKIKDKIGQIGAKHKNKILAGFPLSILAILVVGMFLFASSPVMNDIVLKPASAYTIEIDDNFCMTALVFNGRTSAVDDSKGLIASLTTSNPSGYASFYADANTVKGGYITDYGISCEWFSAFFTGKGYTNNQTNLLTKVNITIWIENPSAVKTYYYPLTQGSIVGYDGVSVDILANPADYTFTDAGTYKFGYEVKYYY